MILRIGTRRSKLALAQTRWVKARLEEAHPGLEAELVPIRTTGDKILDAPLSKIGGKGLFVKEIEEALLAKEVDLAVHSMKDVPADLPEGLVIGCFPERETPQDAFVSVSSKDLLSLARSASVGTSSLRRAAQVLRMRPDLKIVPLRGNVDTRLRKLDAGELDAVILAAAGLRRLGLGERVTHLVPEQWMLPAIGQGALGLEVRRADEKTRDAIRFLNHRDTEVAVRAERGFLRELQGGCQVPIAALAHLEGEAVILRGMVAEVDGSEVLRGEERGGSDAPEAIGAALAGRLLAAGGDRILARIFGGP